MSGEDREGELFGGSPFVSGGGLYKDYQDYKYAKGPDSMFAPMELMFSVIMVVAVFILIILIAIPSVSDSGFGRFVSNFGLWVVFMCIAGQGVLDLMAASNKGKAISGSPEMFDEKAGWITVAVSLGGAFGLGSWLGAINA